jgi:phosphatidate cytidylyltransferase
VNNPDPYASGAAGKISPDAEAARNLAQRVVSAAVLAPVALACAYADGFLFLIACAVAAGAIFYEWTSLVLGRADLRILAPGLVAVLAAASLAATGANIGAIGVIAFGAVLAGVAAWSRRLPDRSAAVWAACGMIYAGVAFLAPVLLRGDPVAGFTAILFLFAIVWSTDIFAYFVGRAVGGPLLWSLVSPKKTWAGAFGGMAGGVAAGTLVAYASGGAKPAVAAGLAFVLSIAAQGGDLFESAIKRRFGAKDASHLIPGHGGVMDRLDGFLVAALAAIVIGVLRQGLVQGLAAPAQGLLIW